MSYLSTRHRCVQGNHVHRVAVRDAADFHSLPAAVADGLSISQPPDLTAKPSHREPDLAANMVHRNLDQAVLHPALVRPCSGGGPRAANACPTACVAAPAPTPPRPTVMAVTSALATDLLASRNAMGEIGGFRHLKAEEDVLLCGLGPDDLCSRRTTL